MLLIRPFNRVEEEYIWVVDLFNTVWPDKQETVEEWKHFEKARKPGLLYREAVAELNGKRVGHVIYMEPWWSQEKGTIFFDIMVHPDHQKKGIGKAIFDHVLDDIKDFDLKALTTKSREDQANALTFVKKLGFEQTMRMPRSFLNLETFDASRFASIYDEMASHNIQIFTMAELKETDPQWKEKLYELRWQIIKDVPSPEPREKPTFEEFEKFSLGQPKLEPKCNFIATDGDEYVGFSNLWPGENPDKIDTGLTGVARSHRRKGICMALKLRGFEFAKAYGAKCIETENEENNPMYQINLRFGFEPQPAWLDFRKAIQPEMTETETEKEGIAQ